MARGHGEKMTRKQEQAIAALLTQPTVEKAAEAAGVSANSLKNWLKDQQFIAAYRAARRQIVERAVGQLQAATRRAVATLRKNLKAPRESDQIRAAALILEHSARGVELWDLAQEVAELRRQLEGL